MEWERGDWGLSPWLKWEGLCLLCGDATLWAEEVEEEDDVRVLVGV